MAAPTLAWVGTAASDASTGTHDPTYPVSGVTAGDAIYVVNVNKDGTGTADPGDATPAAGWTKIGSGFGGTGTAGAGTGPCHVTVWRRNTDADGTENGTAVGIAVDNPGTGTGRVGIAQVFGVRPAAGGSLSEGWASGQDTTSGTAFSATMGSDPGITTDDLVIGLCGLDNQTSTSLSSEGISATSATIGTVTEMTDNGTSAGNDIRLGGWSGACTAGTASAAAVITATSAGNVSGVGALMRVRESAAINLTVANVTQAQTEGNLALVQVPTLVVGTATQAQTEQNLALTQVHNLTVQNATQAQVETNLALTQVHILALQGAVQAQPVQNITLDQSVNLVVNSASQAQVETNLALTQVHVLTVQGAVQAQVETTISMGPTLVVGTATQAQAEQNLALTQVHVLTVQGVVQAQLSTTISLAGATTLVVQNAVQAQPVSNVVLERIFNLVVQNAAQAQSSTSPTLAYNIFLTLQAAVTGQVPVNVVLTQLHQLVIQGSISPQVLALIVLATGALPLVRVGDGRLIQRYGDGTVLNQDQDHGKTLEKFGGGALSRQGDGDVR